VKSGVTNEPWPDPDELLARVFAARTARAIGRAMLAEEA